jgi:hypothetical protein
VGSDPTTIANPYARPRSRSLGVANRNLPPVIWATAEESDRVRFALQRDADPPGMDVIGGSVWDLTHRCLYGPGHADQVAYFWRTIAPSRDEAVRLLQRRMYGFADSVILYEVTKLTNDQEGLATEAVS